MSHWRWLLFTAMARLEMKEDLYLRIPNAKTIGHDVTVDVYSEREPGKAGERLAAVVPAEIGAATTREPFA